MVTLKKLTPAEFEAYLQFAIPNYAQSLSKSRDISYEEALVTSQDSFKKLIPDLKHETKDHFFYRIIFKDQPAGYLWTAIIREDSIPYLYIYDIEVHAHLRGQGIGSATLKELENITRTMGLSKIALNVFGYNTKAFKLYQKIGYKSVAIRMAKNI